jgi:NAD(P)-dependent dehydrogenase (short-subunit alcohol dehydrogenase family)
MIILTGSSGGIGSKILKRLSNIDSVIALYNSHKPNIIPCGKIIYEQLDISDLSQVELFVKKWEHKLKDVTLIHFAAIKIDGLVLEYKVSDWDNVFNINLRANFILTKAILPLMVKNNWGRVIHVSSSGGMDGDIGTISYSSSKSALIGMSSVLAKEYARFNISSNVLALGTFDTGMFSDLSDKQKDNIFNKIPSRKFGSTSDIFNAINFIIKSDYVTSSVINIDGGIRG